MENKKCPMGHLLFGADDMRRTDLYTLQTFLRRTKYSLRFNEAHFA